MTSVINFLAVKTCPQIPDDFFPLLGGWYLNVDLELTYDEGEAFCNTYGANLLLARNVDEYEAARAISGTSNESGIITDGLFDRCEDSVYLEQHK